MIIIFPTLPLININVDFRSSFGSQRKVPPFRLKCPSRKSAFYYSTTMLSPIYNLNETEATCILLPCIQVVCKPTWTLLDIRLHLNETASKLIF